VTDVTVDREQRRPVALDGDKRKPTLADQSPRQAVAESIKLPRAVRGLAQEYQAGVAHGVEQGIQIIRMSQRLGKHTQEFHQLARLDTRLRHPGQRDQHAEHEHWLRGHDHRLAESSLGLTNLITAHASSGKGGCCSSINPHRV